GIVLLLGDQVGARFLVALDDALVDPVVIAQPLAAVASGMLQERQRRDPVVLDDLLQRPLAAFPWHGVVPGALTGVEAALLAEVLLLDLDRRGELDAGGLGEQVNAAMVVTVG